MRALTYLIYITLWEGMLFGGCYYAVFILNNSGWWFALAFALSMCAYSPMKWIHGVDKGTK